MRARRGLVAIALLGACTRGSGTPLLADDESGSSESGVGVQPGFSASDEIRVSVTRTHDLEIGVTGVAGARTRLVIDPSDGPRVSTLTSPRLASFVGEALVLHLEGGAVPSRHVLRLDDGYGEAMLSSGELVIRFDADVRPHVSARLDAEPWGEADALVTEGIDTAGLLARVDFGGGKGAPAATLHRMHRSGFVDAPLGTIALPGLHAREDTRPWVSFAYVPGETTVEDRVHAAWIEGDPGTAVTWIDTAATELETATPTVALSLADLDDDGIELVALGRPLWLGDTLLVELARYTDVERPRPGDRTLFGATLEEVGRLGSFSTATALGTVSLTDIVPAIDAAALHWPDPRLFAARIDGRWPVLLGVEAAGHVVADPRPQGDTVPWNDLEGSLVIAVGPFGSRTVAGCTSTGLRIAWIDALGANATVDETIEVPECRGLAATMVGGALLVLVARGPDLPVVGVSTADTEPIVRELETVHCDEIAVPRSQVLNTGTRTPFVCRQARTLIRGTAEIMIDG